MLVRTAPAELAAAYDDILGKLMLEPVTIVGVNAAAEAFALTPPLDSSARKVVACAGVPTAIVLLLFPAEMDGTLSVSGEGEGITDRARRSSSLPATSRSTSSCPSQSRASRARARRRSRSRSASDSPRCR